MILVDAHLVVDGNARQHKDFYWFGPLGSVIPYVQFVLLVYLTLICSRGLRTVERGMSYQVSKICGKKACEWLLSG